MDFDKILLQIENEDEKEYLINLKNTVEKQKNYRKNFYIQNRDKLKEYSKENYKQNREVKKAEMLKRYYRNKYNIQDNIK